MNVIELRSKVATAIAGFPLASDDDCMDDYMDDANRVIRVTVDHLIAAIEHSGACLFSEPHADYCADADVEAWLRRWAP